MAISKAAEGRFDLRGGGGGGVVRTHTTIKPCRRPLRDIESLVRVKHKLV